MSTRTNRSGITLTEDDAAVVKGMLRRGDRQHDVAAWFGVNGGRIAEIANRQKYANAGAASPDALPPPGPYPCGRDSKAAVAALHAARQALAAAESMIKVSRHSY